MTRRRGRRSALISKSVATVLSATATAAGVAAIAHADRGPIGAAVTLPSTTPEPTVPAGPADPAPLTTSPSETGPSEPARPAPPRLPPPPVDSTSRGS